ncbi:ABC transporter permease subunit [Nocardioides halotolerans]|uniref:branched-chain amino acid ABC transporter ATP-binding protein/permease n=1 Tax=Nocardioides halotolerans TaxID=433660 RepID=UPI00041A626D|nr:ATP-binding cassette domain-containing protein [Nocardioides halotolerans]
MQTFLDAFGIYDYAVRQGLALTLVGLSVFILLRVGLFAMPQIGFMAIGAYTTAVLIADHGWPFLLAALAGGVFGAVSGLVLGVFLSRLSGVYLALATIGFSEIVRELILQLEFTGGAQGIYGILPEQVDLYLVGSIALVLVVCLLTERTRVGLAMSAIRDEPIMAAHQGIGIKWYRISLFVASGFLAGLGGSFFVNQAGFADPSSYSFALLVQVLAAAILGGRASSWGPLLGGIVIFGLPLFLGGLDQYGAMINGALIVLVIGLFPGGLVGTGRGLVTWLLARTRTAGSAFDGDTSSAPSTPRAAGIAVPKPAVAADRTSESPLLSLEGIQKSFGGIQALRGADMFVYSQEVFGLIGPNGSGKTSLLNVLSGVYFPDAGKGQLDGRELSTMWGHPERLSRAGIARTFQGIRLLGELTVAANVSLGAYHTHRRAVSPRMADGRLGEHVTAEVKDLVRDTLAELGLGELASQPTESLPYGVQRKVEIARAIVSQPKLLLLDEPTAGMTPYERAQIFELVQHVRARGVTVVVVEHDVSIMAEHCDRMMVLDFGSVIAVGPADSILKEEAVIDAYIGRPA